MGHINPRLLWQLLTGDRWRRSCYLNRLVSVDMTFEKLLLGASGGSVG